MPEPNRTCKRCGKPFYVSAYRLRRGEGRYCSYSCRSSDLRCHPGPEAVRKSHTSLMQSDKIGHRIAFICDGCGIHFWEYASQRPKPLKFCTRACCLEFQRGKTPSADLDSAAPPKKAEPGMNVVYDPVRREMRNE